MVTQSGREDPRVRRTRRILKAAFIELLQVKTYREITVKDIVNKADYNRATFYHHYKFKEELVDEIVEEKLEGFSISFRYPFRKLATYPRQPLTPADITVFNYVVNNTDFFLLFKNPEAIPGFKDQFLQTITRLFQEIHELKNPTLELPNDSPIIIQAYGLMGLIFEWIKCELSISPNYMAKQLIYLIQYQPTSGNTIEPIHFI